MNAVRSVRRPASVTWSVVSVAVLKAIEAGVVTNVQSATTVSRAVCRVTATCPAVKLANVTLMSASVMILASVPARCSFCLHALLDFPFIYRVRYFLLRFLADCINGRTYATRCRPFVCLSSVICL